jgi:hypothetical protein
MTGRDGRKALVDPVFREALALAKGHASALGETELTPHRLAAGFLGIVAAARVRVPRRLRAKIEALRSAVEADGMLPPKGTRPIRSRRFPLSAALRGIVASRASTLDELLDALREEVSRSAVPGLASFAAVHRIASELAARRGESQISSALFAAASYLACLEGLLDGDAPLAGYLVANSDACDALARTLVPDGFVPTPGSEAVLPLSKPIRDALGEAADDRERLRRAINAGLPEGVRIATERSTAYHEAGHAVVSAVLFPSITVSSVTIVPDSKGGSAGSMSLDPTSAFWERDVTQANFLSHLCVFLAGRAAELIKWGRARVSTGATSDIASATEVAWRRIAEQGLDEEVGPMSLSTIKEQMGQPAGWAFDLAQRRVHHVLKESAERAERILKANWRAVERVVDELLLHKTLDDTKFLASLVRKGLDGMPGVVRATSRAVRRQVEFARRPGVVETCEGQVRYRAGDGIVTGVEGDRWPVGRSYLERFYVPVDGGAMGADGHYEKKPRTVLALQLSQRGRVDMPGAIGILTGEAGDWIVDYGDGDLAVVSGARFEVSYDLAD